MADGSGPVAGTQSTVIVGPLSVTPLYTSTGDNVVWWDGANWRELTVGEVTPVGPAIWDGGATIWDGGLTEWSG